MANKKSEVKSIRKKKLTKKNKPKNNDKNISKLKSDYLKREISNAILIIGIILILGLGCAMIYLGSLEIESSDNFIMNFLVQIKQKISGTGNDAIAAVVNDEKITLKELDNQFEKLPSEYKSIIPKEKLLEQMIDEKLLLREAKKLRIDVSEEEVKESINLTLASYMMDEEQLKTELETQGIEYDEFLKLYKNEFIINKLLNKTITVEVSKEEVKNFYNNNKEQFTIPESINASHILICHNESLGCTSNLSKEEATLKINNILEEIKEGKDFETLAREFSDCPSSQIGGNLGFFIRGQMAPEFEDAAFELGENQVSEIVETVFGFHIIKMHERKAEEIIDLELVKPQIEESLQLEKQQELYLDYISKLRNESKIIVFYKK
ncbi:peptidylprolyl isomerase [Candidatus Woesearchaeota archaeon]|nr:peptidylprolyl isomerase [Candidatus Woesearchaeota archaeon]